MSDLPTACQARLPEALSLVKRLVAIESPSTDKAAVDDCAAAVEAAFGDLGFATRRIPVATAGDQVTAEWASAETSARPILALLHLDTVWPLGTLARMPIREANGRLYGPGALDMKASVAVGWLAARALQDLGRSPRRPIRFLFTSDEEIGSEASVDVIRAEARRSDLVLVMEMALPGGELKTTRKGVGTFKVVAHGRSSHAGGNHERGVNAIEEVAYLVTAVQKLTDYERGTTVNVGVIRGGTRTNVVPDRAEMEVDFRVASAAETERVERMFKSLQPTLTGARLEVGNAWRLSWN